jgi:hypothetical protein
MNLVLVILSVAGFVAALRRFLFSAFRLFKGGVDAFIAREVASSRAERGDVTGLMEARDWRSHTRKARFRAILLVLFWLAVLIAPLLTRATVPIYAAYALLWFLPGTTQRLKRP